MQSSRKYELYSQEFRQQTHQVYARMRQDDPVFMQIGFNGKTPIWFITRFEEVDAVLRDDRRFVLDYRLALDAEQENPFAPSNEIEEMLNTNLLSREGEDHRRLRSLVSKAFTPGRVAALRPRIQQIADQLLDRIASEGQADLVDDYAFPLPIIVIAELLGIPVQDRDLFRVWSDAFVRPSNDPQELKQMQAHLQQFVEYLGKLFEARRRQPGDDLISSLLQVEEAGERLSTKELYGMVVLLIVAGHETTVSLIGNAAVILMQHPDLRQRLNQHPEEIPLALEEFLRVESPVERALTRWVAEDTVLGGQTLKRGELVIAIIGSANRDAERYPDPGRLDIHRQQGAHLAFGRGVHYCLGAPLARLEAEIALTTLMRRLPDVQLTVPVEDLQYRLVPIFHAFEHIPVRW
jgi:cytochrome P450